jgi:hypothetical protein
MNEEFEKTAEQAAAFQKMWAETMSKLMQAGFSYNGDSAPPEVLRQIRTGMFQALGEAWHEFMRSPQFLEGMKQWMEGAVTFRRMTNDFMAKVRNEMQAPSREDIDSIMLSVRHMEKRLLDQVEELSRQVADMNSRLAAMQGKPTIKGKPGKTAAKPEPEPAQPPAPDEQRQPVQ